MAEETPKPARPPWRGVLLIAVGLVLALGASVFAQRTGLGRSLALDFKGVRTIGTAEPHGGKVYRIRYEHPSGSIHRRLYTGRLSGEELPGGELEIAVVFSPEEPGEFQPAGLSYLPGVVAVTMFIAGMWCVLKARSLMRAHYLTPAGKTGAEGEAKKFAPRKPAPRLTRNKITRVILYAMVALSLIVLLYGCPQLNIPSIWDDHVVVDR